MEWKVHGEKVIYESPWMSMHLADIEIPGGERFEHHVMRVPLPAAGVVVNDNQRGILLLWRHRFITDTWGWEIPAGRVEATEEPVDAAAREVLEETGWKPGELEHLVTYHPSNGSSDQQFALFLSDGATYAGEPVDTSESERIEWVPVDAVRRLIKHHQITDGLTLTALLWCLAFGEI
jgi:8-oxo-dGTP pyrophosphatase MutT (NUDIX family)